MYTLYSKSLIVLPDKKMVSHLETDNAGVKLWGLINNIPQCAIKTDLKSDPVLDKRIRDMFVAGIEAEFYEVLDTVGDKERVRDALSFIGVDGTNTLANVVRAQHYINPDVFHRLLEKVLSFDAPLIPTPECLTVLSEGTFPAISKILNLIEDPDHPFSFAGFNGNPLHKNEIFFRYIVNRPADPSEDVLMHGQYWFHQKRSSDEALPIYAWWKETLSSIADFSIVPLELMVEFDNIVGATVPYFDAVDQNGAPLWSLIEQGLGKDVLRNFSTEKLASLIENKRLDSQTPCVTGHSNISNRRVRL